MKLRWTKHCVLSVLGNENDHILLILIIFFFTIKDTKLYVLIITLSAKDSQKLWKLLSTGLERSVYWNEYKTKKWEQECNKRIYISFIELNFAWVNKLFVLTYSNQDDNSERCQVKTYYLPKNFTENFNVIVNGKKFLWPNHYSDTKQFEEIRNLATGQGEDCTTGCFRLSAHQKLL